MKQVKIEQLTKAFQWVAYSAIALGILVRLRLYFSNRSLWFDEVNLALNLVERSYQSQHYLIGTIPILNEEEQASQKRWEMIKTELKQLDNQQRVWIILIKFHDHEKEFLVSHLNAIGQPMQCLEKPGAYTCLYSLQQEKKTSQLP